MSSLTETEQFEQRMEKSVNKTSIAFQLKWSIASKKNSQLIQMEQKHEDNT